MAESSRFRDRKFCLVLYPDDPSHAECVEKLKSGGYNYALILHDKDLADDGSCKKSHWHIVLKFPNAVWNESLAKELGVMPNYIEKARSLDSALLYLVHFGYEEKYQYELADVSGPLQTRLSSLLVDDDESTRVLTIYDLIRNSPGVVTYTEVFEKACKAGLYGDFRRMGAGVMYLINDHNFEFQRETQKSAGVYVSRESFNEYLRWTGTKHDDVVPL